VLEIYQLYRDGMRTANITVRKGVTVGMIQNIVAGRSWRHMHERHGGPMPAERRQRNRLVGKAPIKLVQCLPTF